MCDYADVYINSVLWRTDMAISFSDVYLKHERGVKHLIFALSCVLLYGHGKCATFIVSEARPSSVKVAFRRATIPCEMARTLH
jgi:hypothetical protein